MISEEAANTAACAADIMWRAVHCWRDMKSCLTSRDGWLCTLVGSEF